MSKGHEINGLNLSLELKEKGLYRGHKKDDLYNIEISHKIIWLILDKKKL